MSDNKHLFYAETSHGHSIKVLTEVLQNCLGNEVYLKFERTGIFICCMDNKETILLNIALTMENFEIFKIEESLTLTIAVNLKLLHKLIKNVKKKDFVTLFIAKENPTKLGILIVPTVSGRKSEKLEENLMTIREMVTDHIAIPTGYLLPKVIIGSEYQKMCKKMTAVANKNITIVIQESNYVSFANDKSDISNSKVHFGDLNPALPTYENIFYSNMLNQLIKISGLSPKLQISAPKNKAFPIRFKVAMPLGTMEIFLKSKHTIEMEEVKREELERQKS